jgi:hypothetical protein
MIGLKEIYNAIDAEDILEAHRLVRQRKEEKKRIEAELIELAPKLVRRPVTEDAKQRRDQAFKLIHQGRREEAKALLEEDMSSEEIRFCELICELLGVPLEKHDNLPSGNDMDGAEQLITQAFGSLGFL